MNTVLTYFDKEWAEHHTVAAATPTATRDAFNTLVSTALKTIRAGGKIVFFGNGGSAADAQHLATELTVRYSVNRKPIAALALTDTSALTAIGNDYDFNALFSRQVEALVKAEDLVIGISTSGNSQNILNGLNIAKAIGASTAAFTGASGGRLPETGALLLCVPSQTTARIQEMHIALGQMLCGVLERELRLVPHS
jgi:D-sedoheptulose 7-phosphate isomerase